LVPLLAVLGVWLAWYLLHREPSRETPKPPPVVLLPPTTHSGSFPRPAPVSVRTIGEAEIQSEMRRVLSAIWMAEKSFWETHHRYTTDLEELGYLPDPGELHAKGGFLRPFIPPNPEERERPDFMTFDEYQRDPMYHDIRFAREAASVQLEEASRFCHEGCSATSSSFEFVVASRIGEKLDVWTINEKKVVEHDSAP
jgi:hypothetical protein